MNEPFSLSLKASPKTEQKTPLFLTGTRFHFCRDECSHKKENCQHNCSLITYQMKHTLHKMLGERPNCPKCGATEPVSKGERWLCKNCGRKYTKKLLTKEERSITAKKTQENYRVYRPEHPCPECGSIHIHSDGELWRCGACRKRWIKDECKRSLSISDYPELTNRIVVREVKTF